MPVVVVPMRSISRIVIAAVVIFFSLDIFNLDCNKSIREVQVDYEWSLH